MSRVEARSSTVGRARFRRSRPAVKDLRRARYTRRTQHVTITGLTKISRINLALVLALTACATQATQRSSAVIGAAGAPSPTPLSLSLDTLTGEPIELASMRGRAVLVIAFDHDDLRSHATLRDAERVARAHPDSLTVLAMCGNPGSYRTLRTLLEAFARALDLERTTVVLASDQVREGTSPLGPIEHVPTSILVNRAGIVSRTVVGLLDERAIEQLVRPALPPGG